MDMWYDRKRKVSGRRYGYKGFYNFKSIGGDGKYHPRGGASIHDTACALEEDQAYGGRVWQRTADPFPSGDPFHTGGGEGTAIQ